MLLVEFDQLSKVVDEGLCASWSNVSWNPTGSTAAILDSDRKLSFIDAESAENFRIPIKPDSLKVDRGPWWSHSGEYIAIVSNNQIHVARFNKRKLKFEYISDGEDVSWKP